MPPSSAEVRNGKAILHFLVCLDGVVQGQLYLLFIIKVFLRASQCIQVMCV
jgi:hypothetical protein